MKWNLLSHPPHKSHGDEEIEDYFETVEVKQSAEVEEKNNVDVVSRSTAGWDKSFHFLGT